MRPCSTVSDALSHCVDLTSQPKKSLLRVLAEACTEASDRADLLLLCSRGGRPDYATRITEECPSLLDLLTSHPSCKPTFAQLLVRPPGWLHQMEETICKYYISSGIIHINVVKSLVESLIIRHAIPFDTIRLICRTLYDTI